MKNFKGKSFLAILSLSLMSLAASAPASADLTEIVNSMMGGSPSSQVAPVNSFSQSTSSQSEGANDDWCAKMVQQANAASKQRTATEAVFKDLAGVAAQRKIEEKAKKIEKKEAKTEKELADARRELEALKKELAATREEVEKEKRAKSADKKDKKDLKGKKDKKDLKGKNKKDKKDLKGKKGKGEKEEGRGKRSKSAPTDKRMKDESSLKEKDKQNTTGPAPLEKLQLLKRSKSMENLQGPKLSDATGSEMFGHSYDSSDYNELLAGFCVQEDPLFEAIERLEKLKNDSKSAGTVSSSEVLNRLNLPSLHLSEAQSQELTRLASGGVRSSFAQAVNLSAVDSVIATLKRQVGDDLNMFLGAPAFATDTDGKLKNKLRSFKGFNALDKDKSMIAAAELSGSTSPIKTQNPTAFNSFVSALAGLDIVTAARVFEVLHRKGLSADQQIMEVQKVFGFRQFPVTAENLEDFSKFLADLLGDKLFKAIKLDRKALGTSNETFDKLLTSDKVLALKLSIVVVCLQALESRFSGLPLISTESANEMSMVNLLAPYAEDLVEKFEKDLKDVPEGGQIKGYLEFSLRSQQHYLNDQTAVASIRGEAVAIRQGNSNAFSNVLTYCRELFKNGFDGNTLFMNSLVDKMKKKYQEALNRVKSIEGLYNSLDGDFKRAFASFVVVNLLDDGMFKTFSNSSTTLAAGDSYRSESNYSELIPNFVTKAKAYLEPIGKAIQHPDISKVLSVLTAAQPIIEAVLYPAFNLEYVFSYLFKSGSDIKSAITSDFKTVGVSEPEQSLTVQNWLGSSGSNVFEALFYTMLGNFMTFKLCVPVSVNVTLEDDGNKNAVFKDGVDLKTNDRAAADSGFSIAKMLAGGAPTGDRRAFGADHSLAAPGEGYCTKILFTGKNGTLVSKVKSYLNGSENRKKLISGFSSLVRGNMTTDGVVNNYLGTNGSDVRKNEYILNQESVFENASNAFKAWQELTFGETALKSALSELTWGDDNYSEEKNNFRLSKYFIDAFKAYLTKKLADGVQISGQVFKGDTQVNGLKDKNGNDVSIPLKSAFDAIAHEKLKIMTAEDLQASGQNGVSTSTSTSTSSGSAYIPDDQFNAVLNSFKSGQIVLPNASNVSTTTNVSNNSYYPKATFNPNAGVADLFRFGM